MLSKYNSASRTNEFGHWLLNHHVHPRWTDVKPEEKNLPSRAAYSCRQPAQNSSHRVIYPKSMATYGGAGTLNNKGSSGGYFSRRYFNVNAPAFEPGVRYVQPQTQTRPTAASPLTANYASSSPYSSYLQATGGQQRVRSLQQQVYDSNSQSHCLYTSPHQQIPIQQQSQSIQSLRHPNKYHPASNSINHSTYGAQQSSSQMMYAQNNTADYQQQLPQNEGGYGSQYSQFPISNDLAESIQNSNNRMAIVEVQIGLEQLCSEPHEFELWGNAIKARVASGISKEDANLIAWLIVEMSYMGTNAQYSFSRLCKLLDMEIKNFTIQYVIPRVAHFMGNGVESLLPDYLSNFISFLADLYDKTSVNGVRISRLGHYILEEINVQLGNEPLNDQIVKSLVQSLKLTGRHIEDDQDPARLNRIFEKMNALQNSVDISSAVKNNIRQLNQLRERNWGIVKDETFMNSASNSTSTHNPNGLADGVFYGPDGKPITDEEQFFLEESCRALDSVYSDMDCDAIAEYENFLQNQTKETAFNVAARALERMSVDEEVAVSSPQKDQQV